MVRIAVVEDEAACAEQLREYAGRFMREKGIAADVTVFADGLDIVEDYRPVWDIIFMDIAMKHMDGMEAAKKIRQSDPAVILIFITTLARYAIKGYEVDALDFILKPVNYIQFAARMHKAVNLLNRDPHQYLMLPSGEGKVRICTDDILYLEVINHDLHVVTDKERYVMRASLQDMEAALEGCHFCRCNHCYLVNLKNVTGVQKDSVFAGRYELPVSRPKKKQFLKELSDYLGVGYR